jgi:hypothetical protein
MKKQDKYLTGIGFWIGGWVFSIINIFKIHTNANILLYDYIMTGIAVLFILLCVILLKIKKTGDTKSKKYNYGLGFWIGGGIYSLINLMMNLNDVPHSTMLFYNYLIMGVAVLGLILNGFLLRKD